MTMGQRRKVYVTAANGSAELRVPFNEVTLEAPNPPFRMYDTSGPGGTDPDAGLPPLRSPWIHDRDDIEHYAGRVATLRDDGRASARSGRSSRSRARARPAPASGQPPAAG
jgi:phosphomethylpyrimidine synthase